MDYSLAQEIADKVAAAILRSGRSQTSVAAAAGIPLTTFNRKLNGHTEFGIGELIRIARALGINPSELMPAALLAAA